jgi:soluble lytic murein transglycosylase
VTVLLLAIGFAAPGRGAPPPPDPAARALEAAGVGDLATARRLARHGRQPLLDKLVLWRWLIAPASEPPFAELQRFLEDNPDWPRRDALVRKAERALPDWWPAKRRLAWYNAHPPATAAAKLDRLAALAALGAVDRLDAAVRRLWRQVPLSAGQEAAVRARYGDLLRGADQEARLTNLLDAGAFAAAERQARRLGGAYPQLVEARRKLARREPGVDAAIRALPEALRGRPGLLYERARWRRRAGRPAGVAEILDQLQDPPQPARWWPLRHWTAREFMQAGRDAAAYRVAAGHGLSGGLGFAEGEWLAGWLALRRLDRPADALAHFDRLHAGVSTPVSRARGAYWAGRAADAMGRPVDAAAWYAKAGRHWTAYYGQLARGRLGFALVPDRALQEARRQPAGPPGNAELAAAARLLAGIGRPRLADIMLYTLGARTDDPAGARGVAELAWRLGRPQAALWLGRRRRADGQALPDLLFPRHPLLLDRPRAALLHAIGRQESGFDPTAVSPVGARGLLQLMPATAERAARRLEVPFRRGALDADAAYNVRLGAGHLRYLITRFDGSRLLAIAAYNAGAGRAEDWARRLGDPRRAGVDVIDWIERIPFGETRNYVQRVIEGYNVYRADLGGQAQLPERIARAEAR